MLASGLTTLVGVAAFSAELYGPWGVASSDALARVFDFRRAILDFIVGVRGVSFENPSIDLAMYLARSPMLRTALSL